MTKKCPSIASFREEAIKLISETKQDQRERGFIICKEGNKERISKPCKGSACEVDLGKCSRGKRIFSFHVHPLEEVPIPSPFDVVNASEKGDDCACIANLLGDLVCYQVNKTSPEYKKFSGKVRVAYMTMAGYQGGTAYFVGPGYDAMDYATKALHDDLRTGAGKIVKVRVHEKLF